MRSWLQLKQRVPSRGNPGATRKRKKADSGDGQTLIEKLASTNEMPFGSAAAAARGAQQMSPEWSQRETCQPISKGSPSIMSSTNWLVPRQG
jgi:hypothetical protein